MILVGLGLGPSIPLFTLAIQNAVPPQQIGVATSMATFFRQMGSTVGLAMVGTIFATTLSARITDEMGAVMSRVPPEFRAARGGVSAGRRRAGLGGLSSGTGTFDAEKIEARVHEEAEKNRRGLEAQLANARRTTRAAGRWPGWSRRANRDRAGG